MTDYNEWDVESSSSPTISPLGVQFVNMTVKVWDWRTRQVDVNHLSTTHEDGSVARVYVADGTVLGNVILFSGYT